MAEFERVREESILLALSLQPEQLALTGDHPDALELCHQAVLLAVLTISGHRRLVPRLQSTARLIDDALDLSGEATMLRLQQVAEHLVDAPLAGRGVPAHAFRAQGIVLGPQRHCRRAEQRRDLFGREGWICG